MNRITDVHIHIQPWRDLKPKVQEAMRKGKEDHWQVLISLMDDPRALLDVMDRSKVWRVGLVNYPSPDIMGFTDTTNTFAAKYARANPERLIAYGGVHARYTKDPAGDVDRLVDQGIRLLKIHPPHQGFPANAYTDGLDALGKIYRRCEERGLPVMIHTGTSIFPGARNRFADPMAVDDVAVDFPKLPIVLAHAGRPLYMETAVFLVRRHPNVHLDLSGIPPKRLLSYLPRLAEISDRCLWGTDFPSPGIASMKKNVEDFRALPLSDDAKRRILFDNGAALIR